MSPAGLVLSMLLAGALAWSVLRRATRPAEVERGAGLLAGFELALQNAAEEALAPWGDALPASWAANERAFLAMIRHAEGTADLLGYRALFGHTPGRPVVFDSFADHPRRAVQFTDATGRRLWTSAAGAYQFLAVSPLPTGGATRVDTWDRLAQRLRLPDFSPASQDRAALALIDEAGALTDVRAGNFAAAVRKVRRIWASLPGAGYSQPERGLDWLQARYVEAGGTLST